MGSTLQSRVGAAVADRYEVERELARGGMAVVFLARERKHERRVAIKVLDPDVAAAVGPDRFHREIRLLARLQHPHVCPLLDSGDADGALYYVMPYVAGESLRHRLARGPLPVGEAVRLAAEVADGLGYAHARGVVHRDVKPENILLSGDPARAAVHATVCDFGIARLTGRDVAAALALTDERQTGTGIAVGTPAYMSPEQALGERDVDGRGDVYALGMVLYEMLAGALPYDEATPRAALAARLAGPPARVGDRRGDVPAALDAVLARALAPDPADRWPTADAMRDALLAAGPARPGLATSAPHGWRGRRARLVAGALLVTGAVVAGALGVRDFRARDADDGAMPLDPRLYAVLPFAVAPAAPSAATAVDGDESEQLMRVALGRWTDVRPVDALRVNDARLRLGATGPLTLHEARRVARTLGAGTLVWGRVQRVARRTVVYAALYDVARGDGEPLRATQVTLAPSLDDVDDAFSTLADSLLVGTGAPRAALTGARGTRSVEAWRAYVRGHAALARWDLDGARAAFGDATRADDAYAHAWLWRAQTIAWSGAGAAADGLRDAAMRAAARSASLPEQDAAAARALAALVERRFPDACALYRRLVARDSASFVGWYGLGECQARDNVVVRDAGGAWGWRFRGSYEGAVRAYGRALALLPTVHLAFRGDAFARLQRLLFAESDRMRAGRSADGRESFLAFPEVQGDTLAFAPRAAEVVLRAPPPATMRRAVERNRRLLRGVAEAWVRGMPESVAAQETLARARELTGELAGPASATSAAAAARRLAATPTDRLRLAVLAVRLQLKLGEWDAAERLADSVLAAPHPAAQGDHVRIAGLAALTGRRRLLVTSLRRAAPGQPFSAEGDSLLVPAALAEPALALRAFAALGGPADSVRHLAGIVEQGIDAWVPPERRAAARAALLTLPLELARPALGASRTPPDDRSYIGELQAALARGDHHAVRDGLARLDAERGTTVLPGDVALDGVYLEAWLQAAAGDSAGAARRLDRALGALATQRTAMLDDVASAAALPRAMLLRARLGARGEDAQAPARWLAAASALWRHADAEVRAELASSPAP